MDLGPYHQWFVFAHIVGVFIFLLAHGVAAAVALRLGSERDPVAIRTLLNLSRQTLGFMGIGLAIWFFGGVLAGFSGNFWTTGRYWIWASLAIAIAVVLVMTPWGRFYLNRVRTAVGIDPQTGEIDPAASADPAAIDAAIASGRPELLAAIGVGAVVVLAYLMMFKPF